ncbi:VPS10 domain-containing protein [Neolewinella persica]|uniref:VPS10 domain-containing protein n=1 Tax=Neolewinella persica TaxID=70998 RepID=UPI001B7FB705|nr:hypothetical protein [Neolewinella persica]
MSGRITTLDAVTANPKTIYAGAASGGIWKSENGGTAWRPVGDDLPTQNIGAIRIQQSNPAVVWAGTGEGNPRNSMNLGQGIFKTIDGGKTWRSMGLEATKTIHRILVHPDDPDVVFAGAMGDPFTPNEHRGLYRTTDGGESWDKILFTNDQSGVADMVMDPKNPNKIFVALYEHRRTPWYFTSGGPGSGLYVTYNAGDTWRQLTAADGLPPGDLGRIGLAIAPSNPDRIYAKVEATKNALYRSDDGGDHWTLINDTPRYTNNRPFYFQELAVDPADHNRLYNIYQPLHLSYDGGRTFDPTPMIPADETKGVHADFHAFWVNPNDPQNFIIGGDGGLGITHDHGKSWYFPETMPVAQIYQVNVDEDMPYNVYCGMQDNGNWYGPGYTWRRGGIRTLYWQYLVGGDGFYISPDPEDSRAGYGTSQNGDLYRYDKIGGYYSSVQPPAPRGETLRFNWNAAFARDPFDANTVYSGSQFVHKSTDEGANWTVISPDLSTNNPAQQRGDYGGLTLDLSGAEMYNSILSIAPSSLDRSLIWAGTDDGQVHLTRDGGDNWTNLTARVTGLPKEAWIARVIASEHAAATAWLVVNDYRRGDYAPYLFRTDDYGNTWTRVVDSDDVKGYALSFIQDPEEPNLQFLGTENGLWVSGDNGGSWRQVRNGFPSVSTMDLKIQRRESALIIGTFGRAIWVLDDLKSLRELVARPRVQRRLRAMPMNDAVQVKGRFINPPGNIWTGFHTTFEGENRVFQRTEIPFYLNAHVNARATVSADIYDASGTKINTVSRKDVGPGLQYLTWKLDEQRADGGDEESRGIPVLPGDYQIVVRAGDYSDTTRVTVISDPRFSLDPEVDKQLYAYQKEVDGQASRLSALLTGLDNKAEKLRKVLRYLEDVEQAAWADLPDSIEAMLATIKETRALGQTSRPTERQVGAWQSYAVTAHSKVREAQQKAMSRTTVPSAQDWETVEQAEALIEDFEQAVERFGLDVWGAFAAKLKAMSLLPGAE